MSKTQSTYPTTIDSTLQVDRQAGDVITSASYDVIEDAIYQLETKVGITDSAVTDSIDYRVGIIEDDWAAGLFQYGVFPGLPTGWSTLTAMRLDPDLVTVGKESIAFTTGAKSPIGSSQNVFALATGLLNYGDTLTPGNYEGFGVGIWNSSQAYGTGPTWSIATELYDSVGNSDICGYELIVGRSAYSTKVSIGMAVIADGDQKLTKAISIEQQDSGGATATWGKGIYAKQSAIGVDASDSFIEYNTDVGATLFRVKRDGSVIIAGDLEATSILADGDEKIRFYESGGLGGSTWLGAPMHFDLTKISDNTKRGITMDVRTTETSGTINTGALAIKIYTPPDNGGDVSGLYILHTGGGNAISAYNRTSERPVGYTDYPTQGFAIEGGAWGAKHSIVSNVEDGIAFFAVVGAGTTGRGFVVHPTSDTELTRKAIQVTDTAYAVEKFYVSLAGAAYLVGGMTINKNTATLPTPITGTTLHIGQVDSVVNRIVVDAFGSNSAINFRRAAGTAATPTALQSNQAIGGMGALGYGTTGYTTTSRASITIYTAEVWTDIAQGTYQSFRTTPVGSVTLEETMRLTSGNLRLFYDDSHYSDFTVGSGGDNTLTITPAGGDFIVDANLYVVGGNEFGIKEPGVGASEYTIFKTQSQAANITYTLPAAGGAAGTYLKDAAGNGTLSWAIPTGSSGTSGVTFVVPGTAVAGTAVAAEFIVTSALTITKAYAYVRTAATGVVGTQIAGRSLIFDIDRSQDADTVHGNPTWATIWSTQDTTPNAHDPATDFRLTIEDGHHYGTQTNFNTATFAEGDVLRLNIDYIGSTLPGSDIVVQLI